MSPRRCTTKGCTRAAMKRWAVCEDCARDLIVRAFGPKPEPDLSKWAPGEITEVYGK